VTRPTKRTGIWTSDREQFEDGNESNPDCNFMSNGQHKTSTTTEKPRLNSNQKVELIVTSKYFTPGSNHFNNTKTPISLSQLKKRKILVPFSQFLSSPPSTPPTPTEVNSDEENTPSPNTQSPKRQRIEEKITPPPKLTNDTLIEFSSPFIKKNGRLSVPPKFKSEKKPIPPCLMKYVFQSKD